MALDAWLPIKFTTPDGESTKLALHEGIDWQLYESEGGGRILVAKAPLAKRWIETGLLDSSQLKPFVFNGEEYFECSSGRDYVLTSLENCESPGSKDEALSFADALRISREIDSSSPFQDAIYVERFSRLLPTYSISACISDDIVFGSWLSGGVPVSVQSFRRLRSFMSWMGAPHLRDVVVRGGFQVSERVVGPKAVETQLFQSQEKGVEDEEIRLSQRFVLAGRPELELFINEHVVEIIENEACYKALGIDFPSAIILHGPPGCGKTFAIERLVDYLGWPSFPIEASSVASPYIHETSKKVAEVFDKAIQSAPSVLIIDEMEAFLADRQMGAGSSHHRVEEVAEFLRRIPEAVKNHVLVVAMTNRIEMIDSAILRRGRFDHVVKVDMASEKEVCGLLEKLVSELPCAADVEVSVLAKRLSGRPLSDVSFAVREGARLAARSGKKELNQASLIQAVESTSVRNANDESISRKIGFL